MAAPPCSVCGHKHWYGHVSQPDTPCWHIFEPSKEVCAHLVAKCLWCNNPATVEDGHYVMPDGRYLHVSCKDQMESELSDPILRAMNLNLRGVVVNTDFGEEA